MELNFADITEDEFYELFGFLAGFRLSGHPEDPHRRLAQKLFRQLVPRARELLGDDYEATMQAFESLRGQVAGMDIVLQKKYPPYFRPS